MLLESGYFQAIWARSSRLGTTCCSHLLGTAQLLGGLRTEGPNLDPQMVGFHYNKDPNKLRTPNFGNHHMGQGQAGLSVEGC